MVVVVAGSLDLALPTLTPSRTVGKPNNHKSVSASLLAKHEALLDILNVGAGSGSVRTLTKLLCALIGQN